TRAGPEWWIGPARSCAPRSRPPIRSPAIHATGAPSHRASGTTRPVPPASSSRSRVPWSSGADRGPHWPAWAGPVERAAGPEMDLAELRAILRALRIGQEVPYGPDSALAREWLITNGVGGSASGTVAGAATRRIHALLAVASPHGRLQTLLLKLDEHLRSEAGTF